MNIEEIERLAEKDNRWQDKKEKKPIKSFSLALKVLSFFSVVFSLSIISELFILGLAGYIVTIFSIFLFIIIVSNEFIKVNKLQSLFSFDNSIENKIISIVTVFLSVIVSTYGIYKFLDRTEQNNLEFKANTELIINDINQLYNNKIDSISTLNINTVEPFSNKINIYNNQLQQYNTDRNNVGSNLRNIGLREFYSDINTKIDNINNDIVKLNTEFNEYKSNLITELEHKKTSELELVQLETNNTVIGLESKNNIIIALFLIFTILTEIGIVYMTNKIGSILKYNKNVEEDNDKLEKEKINYIKNTREYKNYILYKTILEKIYTAKIKSNTITINEFKTILKDYNFKHNEVEHAMDELRTVGILGPSIKRKGSVLELDFSDALYMLRKYYEPFFNKF